jgi:hypothetical protein
MSPTTARMTPSAASLVSSQAFARTLLGVHLGGARRRIPPLEVEAPHDQRELSRQVDRGVHGQAVPDGVQGDPQRPVGGRLVDPQRLRQLTDPHAGLLDGLGKHVTAHRPDLHRYPDQGLAPRRPVSRRASDVPRAEGLRANLAHSSPPVRLNPPRCVPSCVPESTPTGHLGPRRKPGATPSAKLRHRRRGPVPDAR